MNLKTTKNISDEDRKKKNDSITKVYRQVREKAKMYRDLKAKYKNLGTLIDNFYNYTNLDNTSNSNSSNKGGNINNTNTNTPGNSSYISSNNDIKNINK